MRESHDKAENYANRNLNRRSGSPAEDIVKSIQIAPPIGSGNETNRELIPETIQRIEA